MKKQSVTTIDGNEAAALIAYKASEVIAIYPITPSTSMGELSDAWNALGEKNIWGQVPLIQEMQSEGGVAGATHGALQTGALSTTFTASQGLLLMVPNMYKIAGELTPTVVHVTARAIATHALSIFGDHSDIMAARMTGWAMLFSNSPQEAMDMALVAHASTLSSRIPFVHAFDGFRTSHEVAKIDKISDEQIHEMLDDDLILNHRMRALSPDHPVIRGTAQNPDVFFQGREAANSAYASVPEIVQAQMDKLAALTGRPYHLYDYYGHPEADRVIVVMGSASQTVLGTAEELNRQGQKVGILSVRLFRPFSAAHFVGALPATVRSIAVLDRTKEPGAVGEPLYQDVVTAIAEQLSNGTAPFAKMPKIVGGRYGLSSKEFTPAMAKGVYDHIAQPEPLNHFTIGINDDVTHLSLSYDPSFSIEKEDTVRAVFWGLGSDGTVGANKNTIKIIGEETDNYAQGYFVYDSKKSGSVTISHLRFGAKPIHAPFLIDTANFVGVHQFGFIERYPVLDMAAQGASVLINTSHGPEDLWENLPASVCKQIVEKDLKIYVLDAFSVAQEQGLGGRINTIMQTAFFKLSGVLPVDEAIAYIKKAIVKSYSRRGQKVVDANCAAVDAAISHMKKVEHGSLENLTRNMVVQSAFAPEAPDFVRNVIANMIVGRGDELPVSAMPIDGTWPTGTAKWERRNIALSVPVWEEDVCIQCGKCVEVCPHAVIRAKAYPKANLAGSPEGFKSIPAKFKEFTDSNYTIAISTDDCTGCRLCAEVCPATDKSAVGRKALNMHPRNGNAEEERKEWDFFLGLPEAPRDGTLKYSSIKNVQLLQPLFEFSGACSGCGETAYVKLISQLFGDRALIANATGCSSIYSGNLPTTPYTTNLAGQGPAWSNSLFEDNAEFGLGMRLGVTQQTNFAKNLVTDLHELLGDDLVAGLLETPVQDDAWLVAQRARIAAAKTKLIGSTALKTKALLAVIENLLPRSVWIIGGDGWSYDIGYGGLDHVLASGHNVNVLVLDTEVYSNTGGQASKSTSRGAVAKFAAAGKPGRKKDLGALAMDYGTVYVATVAMGAKDQQVIKAFVDAESYPGPSLVIAYAHCIAHGIDMAEGLAQQKRAEASGYWPLYRFDPRLADAGENPFQLDSAAPKLALAEYMYRESRFKVLQRTKPEVAAMLLGKAEKDIADRRVHLESLAAAGK
jgi:pyruvate-ferredoxin/flavodoxin oxidoreductase